MTEITATIGESQYTVTGSDIRSAVQSLLSSRIPVALFRHIGVTQARPILRPALQLVETTIGRQDQALSIDPQTQLTPPLQQLLAYDGTGELMTRLDAMIDRGTITGAIEVEFTSAPLQNDGATHPGVEGSLTVPVTSIETVTEIICEVITLANQTGVVIDAVECAIKKTADGVDTTIQADVTVPGSVVGSR